MTMFRHLSALLLSITVSVPVSAQPHLLLPQMPSIDPGVLMQDIRKLASDEFEGRAPGSKGETLTVNYLIERFKAVGAEPGNPDGTWVQKVPLVSITPHGISPLVVTRGAGTEAFTRHDRWSPSASASPTRSR